MDNLGRDRWEGFTERENISRGVRFEKPSVGGEWNENGVAHDAENSICK